MRLQILSAIIVSFVLGAAIGHATRSRNSAPPPSLAPPRAGVSTPASATNLEMTAPAPQFRQSVLPKVIAGHVEDLSPRQQALRLVFDLIPPVLLQEHLYFLTWGNPRMERKAFNLLRALSDPEDLDLFVKLQLLDGMSDPEVRSEFAARTRAERDPFQKCRLAKIVARQWTYGELLPLIEELMADASDPVTAAVMERFSVSRKEVEKEPEFMRRATALMIAAAGSTRSEAVRVNALRALSQAETRPTRFLIDVIVRDRNDQVVCAAMYALPSAYMLDDEPALGVEMIRLLYAIATDESRASRVRFSAARAADGKDSSFDENKILNPEEQAVIEKLLSSLSDK